VKARQITLPGNFPGHQTKFSDFLGGMGFFLGVWRH
jgi:hypothetical protein